MADAELRALRDGPKARVPEIRNAYRFLRGAHQTVSDLLTVAQAEAVQRRSANEDARGRMASWEVDLLRSAIVFTSSGLDATMTRMVMDVGRYLVPRVGTGARAQYEVYLKNELSAKVGSGLRDAIIAGDPANALLEFYLKSRTKASFQGSSDLSTRVRTVLGIPKSRVNDSDLARLDPFFEARNRIVHSMDYQAPDEPGRTGRIHRSRDTVVLLCDTAFEVAADLAHAASDVVVAARK